MPRGAVSSQHLFPLCDHFIETISFRNGNNELPIYKYNLNNTPCSLVLNGEACVYPKNVQLLFPNDEDLKTFGIESYLGMPLIDENKNPLGIINFIWWKKVKKKYNKILHKIE